jgi:hypothetical protein
MDKKTIFLELPSDVVDIIDKRNTTGDRSEFVSTILSNQLKGDISTMVPSDASTELVSQMKQSLEMPLAGGELKVMNKHGKQLGIFDVNTVEGFEQLIDEIATISNDPIVRMRLRKLR